jgi:hypothetical protein
LTSFSEKYARARTREERAAIALHRGFGRSMRMAGSTVYISVTSLTRGLAPRFECTWAPAVPERFTAAEFALFDAFRLQAMAEIRAELEASL